MKSAVFEIFIIFCLLFLNGLFAMIEMAVVSSRKSRLRHMAESGDTKAQAALALVESPNRFLSTTQIGITLVGVLAGAFGGATLAKTVSLWLQTVPFLHNWAQPLSVALVVGGITFFSLVLGELVPKRIGLGNPELISRLAASPMSKLSWLATPVVKLLGASTDAVLAFLRVRPAPEAAVSEEEVKMLVREGELSGALLPQESEMVEAVLGLDLLRVRDLMVPRGDIVWIDAAMSEEEFCRVAQESRHTHFPVYEGRRDNLLGTVSLKDLFAAKSSGRPIELLSLITSPLLVPPTQTLIRLLEIFRTANSTFALVADEFGGIAGIITLHDVTETIIGDFAGHDEEPEAVQREDGSWLVDAMIRLDDFEELFPGIPLGPASERDFSTLSGFILKSLGHIPDTGEFFETDGYRIEIVDLDRHRVDKVLIIPPAGEPVAGE